MFSLLPPVQPVLLTEAIVLYSPRVIRPRDRPIIFSCNPRFRHANQIIDICGYPKMPQPIHFLFLCQPHNGEYTWKIEIKIQRFLWHQSIIHNYNTLPIHITNIPNADNIHFRYRVSISAIIRTGRSVGPSRKAMTSTCSCLWRLVILWNFIVMSL